MVTVGAEFYHSPQIPLTQQQSPQAPPTLQSAPRMVVAKPLSQGSSKSISARTCPPLLYYVCDVFICVQSLFSWLVSYLSSLLK